jgi:thiamine-monophosphate kinase
MLTALARIAVGIGDDAAVLGDGLVLASDMLVEGVHFTRAQGAFAIGHRAAAANLSDMAAMGAEPVCLVAALGLPVGFGEVEALTEGIAAHGVPLVGGDLSRSEVLVVSIAALGRADRPVLRSGGRPGDVLAVTGRLGGQAVSGYTATVVPRLAEGMALAAVATAMIDLSDGIAADAPRLAEASGCGAVIELARLPLASGATPEQAACGGEDYELLAALPPDASPPVEMTEVGRLTAEPGVRIVDASGRTLALRGWDHFA